MSQQIKTVQTGIHYLYNTRVTGTVIDSTSGFVIGDDFSFNTFNIDHPVKEMNPIYVDGRQALKVKFNDLEVVLIDVITELTISEFKTLVL